MERDCGAIYVRNYSASGEFHGLTSSYYNSYAHPRSGRSSETAAAASGARSQLWSAHGRNHATGKNGLAAGLGTRGADSACGSSFQHDRAPFQWCRLVGCTPCSRAIANTTTLARSLSSPIRRFSAGGWRRGLRWCCCHENSTMKGMFPPSS